MINVPMVADRQVAKNTPPQLMPVADNMSGFTKMIYAIVKKVVNPATISRLTFVSFDLSSKKSFTPRSFA
jgi:hypothetical protein